ncbi:MAG TPA: hypothetical protein PKM41_16380 [Deltaproteobacteria bacterium]|jgi:hypothetical protein|nr:hypothetical protein [Deltaproteobacteria bacterium]HOI06307.1 hypothetical protein [Deltaproteobacteria bacterium]
MNPRKLKKARSYGPDVRLITLGEILAVEKTYRDKGAPVRLLGSILVAWERFIYSRLDGLEGIPGVLPGADRYTLLTVFMGGRNLREAGPAPGKTYYESLKALIKGMHARGVIHLDLRNRRNYGIDEEGRPYLVDFASGVYLPWRCPGKRLLEAIDWMGYAKVKEKLSPGLLDRDERRLLERGNLLSSLWLPTKALRAMRKVGKKLGRQGR